MTTKPTVPAVARAAGAPHGLTLGEIARAIGAPKSSVLSVCATLVAAGLLVRTDTGAYELGWKVVQLGRSYLARSAIATEFRRVDIELGPLAEDTIVLSLLDGRNVLYVHTRALHGQRQVAARRARADRHGRPLRRRPVRRASPRCPTSPVSWP